MISPSQTYVARVSWEVLHDAHIYMEDGENRNIKTNMRQGKENIYTYIIMFNIYIAYTYIFRCRFRCREAINIIPTIN